MAVSISMSRPIRRLSGFTLIELLVVIAIVGVLLSILLPSLSGARRRAKATQCLMRIKEIGTGFGTYAGDNGEQLPPALYFSHPIQLASLEPNQVMPCEMPGFGWGELLYEYLFKESSIADLVHFPAVRNYQGKYGGFFNCPSAETSENHAGHMRLYLFGWANKILSLDEEGRAAGWTQYAAMYSPRVSELGSRLPVLGESNEYSNHGDGIGITLPPHCSVWGGCPVIESAELGMGHTPDAHPYGEANMHLIHCRHAPNSANSFAHRHDGKGNYLYGDLHAEADSKLPERLACDWDMNGIIDPRTFSSREWSNCPKE